MVNEIVERQIEAAVRDTISEKAMQIMKSVGKIASKQGGESMIENYQLLGKRALIVVGSVVVVVQVVSWVGGLVVSRRMEKKRIEQTVRRVLEEERAKEATEAIEATA